jgi:hypothetical protein
MCIITTSRPLETVSETPAEEPAHLEEEQPHPEEEQQEEAVGEQSSPEEEEEEPVMKARKRRGPYKKKEKRCKKRSCPYCTAEPCGDCRPCRNPRLKSKCILR